MVQKSLLYLLSIGLCLLLINCNSNNSSQSTTYTGLNGRYINASFLNQVQDSTAGSIQTYCYEMNFKSADSVIINYGFERGTLAYQQKTGSSYALLAAQAGKDLIFTVNPDSSITLHDSTWIYHGGAWIGTPLNSKFKRVSNSSDDEWVFKSYLNEKVIIGHYILNQLGQSNIQQVVFRGDGKVNGLFNYTTYDICFSGDCIGETQKPSNIISLIKANGAADTFVFTINTKKSRIAFYELENPLIGRDGQMMKGGRSIGRLAFELKKDKR